MGADKGDAIQAFAAKMMYWPEQGTDGIVDWGEAHQYRLAWLVQMITDKCDPTAPSYNADRNTCKRADRVDELDIIHVYYEDWQLSGFNVSESQGLDVAVIYEDPQTDPEPTLDDDIWRASWNLSTTWVAGRDCGVGEPGDATLPCAPDGQLDVTVSGAGSSDDIDTAVDKWSNNTSHLEVKPLLNYAHSDYIGIVGKTEVEDILETEYSAYTDRTPTFLFAQEKTARAVGQGDSQAQLLNRQLTLDFNSEEIETVTVTGMSWATYRYLDGKWQNYALDNYLAKLDWAAATIRRFLYTSKQQH